MEPQLSDSMHTMHAGVNTQMLVIAECVIIGAAVKVHHTLCSSSDRRMYYNKGCCNSLMHVYMYWYLYAYTDMNKRWTGSNANHVWAEYVRKQLLFRSP